MKTPYDILEVVEQATDAEIKQAYLQKVKQFPPDHYHEQFQQIHQAYETIKDLSSRTKYALFTVPEADFNTLLEHAFNFEQAVSISAEHFDKLLRAGINDKTFKIAASDMTKTL
ncbi:MAG: DnaJ domain-containing protein [Methylobacter sp.]|nr:DnaJ domain-containing protein [Methylobacter sp.]